MKTILFKQLLFLLIMGITITTFIISCEKENKTIDMGVAENSLVARGANNPQSFIQSPHNLELNQELNKDDCFENAILKKNDIEEQKYDQNLDIIAVGLVELTKNTAFVKLVNEEVAKQFDGDDNVLLRDMKLRSDEKGIDLANLMRTSIIKWGNDEIKRELKNLNGTINSFTYYGKQMYTQIYIPFFDEVNHSIQPVIVVNKNDDLTLPGYELKVGADGVEDFKHITVNKAQAQIQPIWVISVNERVNCNGNIVNSTGVGKSSASCDKWLEFYPKIMIMDKKENWGNGRADISISWVTYTNPTNSFSFDFCDYTNTSDYHDDAGNHFSYNSIKGAQFLFVRKVSNAELNTWLDIHFEFELCWPKEQNRLFLIVYEADRKEKYEKVIFPQTDMDCALEYKSKQDPYWHGFFEWSDYVGIGQWDGTTTQHTTAGEIDFFIRGREW